SAVLLAGLAFVGVGAAATFGYFASDLPAASDLATVPIPLTTHIYDRSGEHLLYTLSDERRDLISIDAVPKRMQDATIAIEDKSFWTNPGVDVGGIIRAFQVNSASGRITQGGSTITQQLIKTRLLGDDPTFTQDQRGDPRRRGDADVQQVADPRDVLQPDLLREPGVRPEGGSGHLLRRHRPDPADARPDGTPRGSPTGAVRLRPDPEHGGREGAPGPRAGRHGRERLRHCGGGRSGEERGARRQASDHCALRAVVH